MTVFVNPGKQAFKTAGTWNLYVPSDVEQAEFEVWGGTSAASSVSRGPMPLLTANAGGYALSKLILEPGETLTIVIAVGGAVLCKYIEHVVV